MDEDTMKKIERLISDSRNVINVTKNRINSKKEFLLKTDRKKDQPRSFPENLLKLYHEEQVKCSFQCRRDILRKFVEENNALCLVFKIYSYRKMFNVEVKRGVMTIYESQLVTYDDETLMDYLDREEIPPVVVTSLTRSSDEELFLEGGVISQLRFYRSSISSINEISGSFYVYLRLLTESKLALLEMYGRNPGRTKQEIANFESRMMKATSGPLCLEPTHKVSVVTNHLMYEKKLFSNPQLKRIARRNLLKEKAKRSALDCVQTSSRIKAMRAMISNNFFSDEQYSVDVTKNEVQKKPKNNLYAAANFELKSMNKKICRLPPLKRSRKDNTVFQGEEDKFHKKYYLESMLDNEYNELEESAVINITKNTADKLYRGTLSQSCESDTKAKSVTRTFPLGFHDAVDRFTDQFIEIFTDAGCKPAIIQQSGPGDESKTEFTPFVGDSFESS